MAPLTRSARTAATGGPTLRSQAAKEPEIISIDEDDQDESMEDEGVYEDEEVVDDEETGEEETGDDEDEDEDMDRVDRFNGNGTADTGSAFPVLEPSLKSVIGVSNKMNGSPQLFTAAGAQEAFDPLRRTADRVTKQIEAFAKELDQFKQKNSSDEFENIQAAYDLVDKYQKLTRNAIHETETQQKLKRAKTFRSSGTDDPKVEDDLRRLQLELNTWRLLLNLISIDDPASRASFKEGRQMAFQNLHRYSSDREIWEQFLNADQYALECVVAMRWLEETSKADTDELDDLIADMEAQAERGEGLWSHGWLFTKEAIKGHKRLRAWPQPLEPHDTAHAMLKTDDQKLLVTQLDPDALLRQEHSLQAQDESYERSTWMTCWKMLRQGENWTHIREWAQSRLENWRAVSLCGSSVDANAPKTRTPVDDGTTRMMSSRAQDSWRSACSALAKNKKVEPYERAVYGLLCGDSDSVVGVCNTWDDCLYVYFNRIVLLRYQGFCKQFQRKLSHSPNTAVTFTPETPGHADLEKFFQYLRGHEKVGGEARNPFRNLQAAILSKGYDSYFSHLAQAVSQVGTRQHGAASIIPKIPHSHVDDAYLIAAEDEESIRIVTHVYLVARTIGYSRPETIKSASIVMTGLISNLEARGLFELIPVYASLLPTEMCHEVFSKILIDIVNPKQRKEQVRLSHKHGIDINSVLGVQWSWLSTGVSSIEHSRGLTGYSRVVRRPDGSRVLVPPKKDMIGTSIADEDENMIRSLEWLRYVGGQWPKICKLGGWLYRKFFVAGKLSAARELSHRMPLSEISQEAFGFDILEFPDIPHEANQIVPEKTAPTSPSKSRKNGAHRRSLSGSNGLSVNNSVNANQQCALMLNFESLALGFDSLENFAILYDQISRTKRRRDSGTVKDLFTELADHLNYMEQSVGQIVEVPEWPGMAENSEEEQDYAHIRRTYLPELILDYHNSLYYASNILEQSELLTQCMVVATLVAKIPHLTRSFTEAQRMAELMDVLALAGKAMVMTDPKHDTVGESGQTLGVWRVSAPDGDDAGMLQQLK